MKVVVTYLTIADIAQRLDVPRHRVRWIIASREIEHSVTVGEVHGFAEQAAQEIEREIKAIDSKR